MGRTHYEAEYIAQPQGSYDVTVVAVMVEMTQAAPSAIVVHPASVNVPTKVH